MLEAPDGQGSAEGEASSQTADFIRERRRERDGDRVAAPYASGGS